MSLLLFLHLRGVGLLLLLDCLKRRGGQIDQRLELRVCNYTSVPPTPVSRVDHRMGRRLCGPTSVPLQGAVESLAGGEVRLGGEAVDGTSGDGRDGDREAKVSKALQFSRATIYFFWSRPLNGQK